MANYIFHFVINLFLFLADIIVFFVYPTIPYCKKEDKLRYIVLIFAFIDLPICGFYFGMIAHSLGVR